MNLSDLFTNIETSKKLVEAGVSIPTLFVHTTNPNWGYKLVTRESFDNGEELPSTSIIAPAFTAQELSEWLDSLDVEEQVQDYFDGCPPSGHTDPNRWASCILELISQNIITPK